MLLRRLLGIFILSVAVVVPVSGQDKDAKKDDKPKDETKKDAKTKDEKPKDEKAKDDKKDEKKPDDKKEKALLKWKFEKDKVFYQKMSTKTTQTMKVMTNEVKQVQEQTFYFKWTVTDVKTDEVILKQSIEGVVMNIDIGNQKIAYDSTNAKDATANNPLADFFKALKGAEFTITLNTKDMTVTKIDGRPKFIEDLGKQNPQMKPLLETILSEKALMQMSEPTFSAIPGKEVSVGEKWTKKTSLDMGPIGKYENEYTYTYEGKDKKLDKIKVETALKYAPPNDAAGGGTGGLPFKIKSADLKSTKADGTILFNPETGRIETSTMNLKLSGKLSIEIGGQTTDVDLDQVQDSSVTNTDKSELPEAKKP